MLSRGDCQFHCQNVAWERQNKLTRVIADDPIVLSGANEGFNEE